jgi:hypothetical protein
MQSKKAQWLFPLKITSLFVTPLLRTSTRAQKMEFYLMIWRNGTAKNTTYISLLCCQRKFDLYFTLIQTTQQNLTAKLMLKKGVRIVKNIILALINDQVLDGKSALTDDGRLDYSHMMITVV